MAAIIRHTDILGGIVGGFRPGGVPFAGWRTYQVVSIHTDPAGIEFPAVRLRQISGPRADTIAQVKARTGSYFVPREWPYASAAGASGSYPAFAWYFLDPATMARIDAPPILPLGNTGSSGLIKFISAAFDDKIPIFEHVVQWFEHTPPTGPYIGCMVSREPSDDHPIFVAGRPVEIATAMMTRRGETFDVTSAADCSTELGIDLGYIAPIQDGDETAQDLYNTLSEGFGFLVRRSGVSGKNEFQVWRAKVSGTPGKSITITKLTSETGPTFDISDATRINRVRVVGQVISNWVEGQFELKTKSLKLRRRDERRFGKKLREKVRNSLQASTEKPAHGLTITSGDVTFDYSTDGVTADADLYGEEEVEIDLRGMPALISSTLGAVPINLEHFGEGIARLIFDTQARGRQMGTVLVRRNTSDAPPYLGEAVNVTLAHLPNAQLGQTPTSQRGGSRPFRVVEHTPLIPAHKLALADEGTGVPLGIAITLSVSQVATPNGKQALKVSVSPADDLAAAKANVEFQVRAFSPDDTIDVTDPGFRYTIKQAAGWTDEPHEVWLGDFPADHVMAVRARGWLTGGGTEDADWSLWYTSAGPITGPQTTLSDLVIDQIAHTSARLTWSYDESPQVGDVVVQYRAVGSGIWLDATGSPFAPGTETTTLTALSADEDYEVRVILDNSGEYGDELVGQFHTSAGAISGLTLGTPSTNGVALSWTNTHPAALVRVEVKLDTVADYSFVVDLPAGSTNYLLTGLIPETDYDVRVVLVSGGVEVGTALTDSFTTDLAANQTQLAAPTNAQVYGGARWNGVEYVPSPGTFGIIAIAPLGPPDLELVIEEAVETAPGSGTPGAYSVVATIPAVVAPDVTRYEANAPNDGLHRFLRAFARASGYLDSDTTIEMEVDPWPDTPTVPDPTGPALDASRVFDPRFQELGLLRHESYRTFLGITAGGAGVAEDDAEVILAGQIFGP